jgi:glycosyltransferase involved in cell wall biosynthesis
MDKNTLTVIIPTYNRKTLLIECLDAFDNQTDKRFNLIISDNYSSDGTSDLLNSRYSDKTDVVLNFNEKNIGLVNNINKALTLAKTEWITIVSDDDYVNDNFVELVNFSIANSEKKYLLFSHNCVDNDRNLLESFVLPKTTLDVEQLWNLWFSKGRPFSSLTVPGISGFVFNREIIKKNTLNKYYRGFYSDLYLIIEVSSLNGADVFSDIIYNRRIWKGSTTGVLRKNIILYKNLFLTDRMFKKDLLKFWSHVYEKYNMSKPLDKKIRKYCKSNLVSIYIKYSSIGKLFRHN